MYKNNVIYKFWINKIQDKLLLLLVIIFLIVLSSLDPAFTACNVAYNNKAFSVGSILVAQENKLV